MNRSYEPTKNNLVPDFSTFKRVQKSSRGHGGGMYQQFDNLDVIIVTHDSRVLLPKKVYAYLNNPTYIGILQNEAGWISFTKSLDSNDFKVQGNRGGKKGIATLDCLTLVKTAGLSRPGFKSVYDVILSNGAVYLNSSAGPRNLIEHTFVKRSK